MGSDATHATRAVVPTLRYRDLPAALDWLCNAFGFERHVVVAGEDGAVRYAQLKFGDGLIMLAPVEDTAFDQLMLQPSDMGGAETQICYLFVDDAQAHYDRATAAGAEILFDIGDGRSAGRGYSCRDPEGHIWNFGTYDPWRRQGVRERDDAGRGAPREGRFVFGTGLAILMSASVVVASWMYTASGNALGDTHGGRDTDPAFSRITTAAAARTLREARDQIARERTAREEAERTLALLREQLGQERSAKQAAERAAQAAREAAAAKPVPENPEAAKKLAEAERTVAAAQEQAAHERSERETAERAGAAMRDQLARERAARETAERLAKEAREHYAKLIRRVREVYGAKPYPSSAW